ncbi:DUF6166 domain-containing protein [Leptolyngbya sp. AN03gr2]|uniref:DUF6166 domain-containing protein n=1 Tax=unclassified Leptolyngbya TaxID=2650499 RepID=UPI003D3229C3
MLIEQPSEIKEVIGTTLVNAVVYEQLLQLWDDERLGTSHTSTDAFLLAEQLNLIEAADWIQYDSPGYEFGQQTGRWKLDTGRTFNGTVVCRALGASRTHQLNNVPRLVLRHNCGGGGWGYGGSGPHDLALNILTYFLPPGSAYGTSLWFQNTVSSKRAAELHSPFARTFLVDRAMTDCFDLPELIIRDWIKAAT